MATGWTCPGSVQSPWHPSSGHHTGPSLGLHICMFHSKHGLTIRPRGLCPCSQRATQEHIQTRSGTARPRGSRVVGTHVLERRGDGRACGHADGDLASVAMGRGCSRAGALQWRPGACGAGELSRGLGSHSGTPSGAAKGPRRGGTGDEQDSRCCGFGSRGSCEGPSCLPLLARYPHGSRNDKIAA